MYFIFSYLQEIDDLCDDTLSIFAIRDGQKYQLNSLRHNNNALIMVEDVHIEMVFTSCERTHLQTARGFIAQVTYQGMFSLLINLGSTLSCIAS